jgi:hypothetical protein
VSGGIRRQRRIPEWRAAADEDGHYSFNYGDKTIVGHARRRAPPACARLEADNAARRKNFHLVAAFDFHRQFVLNGTRAEYDRCISLTIQRPIIDDGVSPDVTPNSRRCTPVVASTDFAIMKQCR